MAAFIIGIPFVVFAIVYSCGNQTFPYYYIHLILIGVVALLCYVSGDVVIYKYKKSREEINPFIPEEIHNKANGYRLPFIIALIISLLFIAVFFIIFLSTGHWPML